MLHQPARRALLFVANHLLWFYPDSRKQYFTIRTGFSNDFTKRYLFMALDKRKYRVNIFHISPPKDMLWILIRSTSYVKWTLLSQLFAQVYFKLQGVRLIFIMTMY